ncbi:hypothetical protein LX88_004210 [Lentzea californiensis]|nr:hypothetical protein [Lentzea californiensis]
MPPAKAEARPAHPRWFTTVDDMSAKEITVSTTFADRRQADHRATIANREKRTRERQQALTTTE